MGATITGAGLEGVIAADSEICYIDGVAGVLSYRGYNIHTLAENALFEEVIYLLWNDRLPSRSELDDFRSSLVAARSLPAPVVDFLLGVPEAPPMDILRTAVSMLALYDPDASSNSPEANLRKAVRLMSQSAAIVTTFDRLRNGREIIDDDPDAGFAATFLYTLTGKSPDDIMENAFDVALILHADHEFNASTFAARVTASTLSDIHSAVTSAIGALKGPLHGGANQDVIRLLLKAGTPENAVEQVKDMLNRKTKVPGFGHRVYRTEDPRATHLRALSEDLGRRTGQLDLYKASREAEQTVKAMKGLNANVDFYSASTYYSLGVPVDLFTPVFAISRMSGWTAHVMEQYSNNRLIRPRTDYKGHPDGRPWVPLNQR
jgi:citrate synthase